MLQFTKWPTKMAFSGCLGVAQSASVFVRDEEELGYELTCETDAGISLGDH